MAFGATESISVANSVSQSCSDGRWRSSSLAVISRWCADSERLAQKGDGFGLVVGADVSVISYLLDEAAQLVGLLVEVREEAYLDLFVVAGAAEHLGYDVFVFVEGQQVRPQHC